MLQLKPQERAFDIKPVGVKYICEFCNEGEMVYKNDQPVFVEALNMNPVMHHHICTKCGKSMQLPKMYPYIEWISDEDQKDNQ